MGEGERDEGPLIWKMCLTLAPDVFNDGGRAVSKTRGEELASLGLGLFRPTLVMAFTSPLG